MKTFLSVLLFMTSFSVLAFADANDVQVVIDGTAYKCSADGSSSSCSKAADMAFSKFNACKKAGYSGTTCYDQAFKQQELNCTAWSELCNRTCQNVGYASTTCFSYCYP
jgi:hypothetical protein